MGIGFDDGIQRQVGNLSLVWKVDIGDEVTQANQRLDLRNTFFAARI